MISDSPPPPKTRRLGTGASSTSTGASSTSTGASSTSTEEPTRDSLVAAGKETADPLEWVKERYRVPVNAELHYNHMLDWNGVAADEDSSFTSVHVKDIFKLARAARKLDKAKYTPDKGFLTPPEFAAALRAKLEAQTENKNRDAETVIANPEELRNSFLGKKTGP